MIEWGSRQHCVELSWALLEYKLAYYRPELVHPDNLSRYQIPDHTYDQLEATYKKICTARRMKPSISEMVDFDVTRGSSKMVMQRLANKTEGAIPFWDKVKRDYVEPELLF
jgi:hypothetical protein